jgi:hypothetical protein
VWAAVNHHDTDNPHVHIIIRGVDRDGDDVRIDGRYIAREMRWRAQEIVTKELGPRLESEIAQLRKWEIAREGLGRIDQTLASCLSVDRVVSLAVVARMPREVRTACLARLETLSRMQLAQKEPRGMWRLVPEWKELLTRMQIGSDVRGRLYRHIPASLGQGVTLEPSQGFATLEGIIRGIGLHDELGGAMYLAVQDAGGAAYYVQVRPEVAEGFRVGDKVRISRPVESWTKSTDRIIARFALQNGGVYDPVGHERALMALGSREVGGALVSAQDLVRANVRRLERLEKYGLAQRLPAGRWHIPADLVGQLEARERTHPRHRIQIERLGQDRDVDRSAAERPMGRRRGPDRSR